MSIAEGPTIGAEPTPDSEEVTVDLSDKHYLDGEGKQEIAGVLREGVDKVIVLYSEEEVADRVRQLFSASDKVELQRAA